jgi:hypothetical protein
MTATTESTLPFEDADAASAAAETTAGTTDVREFEAEFEAPAAPAVPAYLVSAARRRAEDAERGTGGYSRYMWIGIAGLVISLGVFAGVAYDDSLAAGGDQQVSSTTAP